MSKVNPIKPEEMGPGTPLTHVGWFLLCPVYLGDPASAEPMVVERNWVPHWWWRVNEGLQAFVGFLCQCFEIEPVFLILQTGELK